MAVSTKRKRWRQTMPTRSRKTSPPIGCGKNWRKTSDFIPRIDVMLKRCESIAHHENHVDRRSYEPVAAPRQRIEKETLMRWHRLIIGLLIKHILEGRYFPFYMYGQAYNAGAAWEAYLAAIAFAVFGVSVISLKSCIVVLSLFCLLFFYRMCLALYDKRTALLAAIGFALMPS